VEDEDAPTPSKRAKVSGIPPESWTPEATLALAEALRKLGRPSLPKRVAPLLGRRRWRGPGCRRGGRRWSTFACVGGGRGLHVVEGVGMQPPDLSHVAREPVEQLVHVVERILLLLQVFSRLFAQLQKLLDVRVAALGRLLERLKGVVVGGKQLQGGRLVLRELGTRRRACSGRATAHAEHHLEGAVSPLPELFGVIGVWRRKGVEGVSEQLLAVLQTPAPSSLSCRFADRRWTERLVGMMSSMQASQDLRTVPNLPSRVKVPRVAVPRKKSITAVDPLA